MSGSDIFLINKSIELILATAKVDPLNVTRMDEDATLNAINGALANVSMFGGGQAVIVRADTTRVYLKSVKSDKELEKVDCNPMAEDLVVKMILQNKKFNPTTAGILARECENNYSSVNNEMQKLDAYVGDRNVTENDIAEIVTRTIKNQVFDINNYLLKRDDKKAWAVIDNLTAQGVDDYAVFGNLLSMARRLFYSKMSPRADGDLAKIMAVHPYSIISTRRDAKHISPERATAIYKLALDLEYQIKSGRVAPNRAIQMLARSYL